MAHNTKTSRIRVNDVFNELTEENKRLLNELMFANKCLKVLFRFKTFVDLVFDKLKTNLDSNDSQKFEEFGKEIEKLLNQTTKVIKTEDDYHDYDYDSNSDSNYEINILNPNPVIKFKRRSDQPNGEKTFLCDVNDCEFKTHLKRNLMNHLNLHKDGNKPFKCHYTSCGKHFFAEQSLKCHIRIAHKFRDKYLESGVNKHIGKYKCDSIGCDYETKIKKLFNNHMNHHKGVKPFLCEFISCGKNFISEEGLKWHTEYVHKNLRQFKCHFDGCDYESYNSNRFTNHINAVHKGIRPFECEYCRSQFGCKSYLRDHIRKVHESTPNAFKCDFAGCLKSFKDNKYMRNHYKIVHLKQKKVKVRRLSCNEPGCQYKADCEAVLKIHKTSHSDERPFKCTFDGCLKSFKVKGNLKSHTEECHLGKTFKCDAIGCDMTFSNRTTWKNHFEIQHSNKILPCDWPGCDYTTKVERNLRKHKLVHKSVAEHLCDWPQCNKRFKSRAYLLQHMRIHNNDKRFICSWPGCQYRCAHSGNINKHRKTHEKKFM